MNINLVNQTVTFASQTTLTLDQLVALTALFEYVKPGPVVVMNNSLTASTDDPVTPGVTLRGPVKAIYTVASSADRDVEYVVVQFEDESYACSCPDWIYRRSMSWYSDPCKHILNLHRRVK